MKIGAFPPESSFLAALARRWLGQGGESADGLILLPSKRAAQALAGAFLAENGGKALLLPRITATGAIDEAGLSLGSGLDLPPAISAPQRQAVLAKLILQLNGADGAPTRLPAAWALAADLAALLDEAEYAEVDLAVELPNVVEADLANHWQKTLKFLKIITEFWPAILAQLGRISPAARQVQLLDAQAQAWRAAAPAHRVWLVTRGGAPVISRLARVVAGLANGLVILPGYDFALDDAAWESLEDSHAQAGIARLLGEIGARRDEILRLDAPESGVPAGRVALLSRALLPAAVMGDWQHKKPINTNGLLKLEARDEAQNATAIAMILRDALEFPGRTAALVTPDRGLAIRVAAALKRFGITADDSAGENLDETPPAVFLRLLARAAAAEYAPLPLLALLKHPLTAAGLPPEICREQARRLELSALRGPRPSPGLDGLKFRLEEKKDRVGNNFLARLEVMLRPLALPLAANPAASLRGLIEAAEKICGTAEEPGAARLWSGEAGTTLSDTLLEALAALEDLPDMAARDLPDLLDQLLKGVVVRRPRAKDGHPRVAIWGVQEAALQRVDAAVLGGLTEGVWPAAVESGPWLSRPMRKAAGLPSPELKIGEAAHDFFALACACPEVVLAAPRRRERAPAVPARWLTRLEVFCAGAGAALAPHPAAGWALLLDAPRMRQTRAKPRPCPPAVARPKRLSISDFATLMADPYAIYARRILKISVLDALDEESDPSLFGEIVHAGLAEFFAQPACFDAADGVERLNVALQNAMRKMRPRAALENWWAARLERIAAWIFEAEVSRRAEHGIPVAIALEQRGELEFAGGFMLNGRADRIEKRADGGVFIMDYKTGAPPNAKDVEAGSAPQLPLEAVLAEAGGFGVEFGGTVSELAYWQLSGRHEPGTEKPLFEREPEKLREVIARAAAAVPAAFEKYARGTTPYLAAPHPARSTYEDVYAGISRRAEWDGESE